MFRYLLFTFSILSFSFLCCGSLASNGARVATVAPLDQSGQAEAVPAAAGINQDVMAGDVRWKVIEVKDLGQTIAGDTFMKDLSTSGKFVLVKFEIENRGTEPEMFLGVKLVDGQGREFENSSDAIVRIKEGLCALETLNPNVAKTCIQVYELPADAAGLKLKAGDLELFGDEALIDLGL